MSRVREKMERFRREREVSEECKVEKHSAFVYSNLLQVQWQPRARQLSLFTSLKSKTVKCSSLL